MLPSARTRPTRAMPVYTTVLAWLFAAACAFMAILALVSNDPNWERLTSLVYLAATVLVAAGLYAFRRGSPRLAFALVALGALDGGFFLVWTLVIPVLGLALIVLFARSALRGSSISASASPAG